jgi:MFS family permease
MAVSAGIFIGTYDVAAVSVALPQLVQNWHISTEGVALLGSSTLIGMIFGSLLAGPVADRFGRRMVLLLDFFTYGGAAFLSALSPDLTWLVIARVVVGLGVGADFAVVFAYIVEYFSNVFY